MAVLFTEMFLEEAGLGAGTADLEDEHRHEKQEQIRAFEEKKESRENDGAEYIDGIANARIDAVGNQLICLRRQRERIAKLDARDSQKDGGRGHEDQPGEAQGRPWRMRELVDEISDSEQRHDRDQECAAFHFFVCC